MSTKIIELEREMERGDAMTNKPEVVAWSWDYRGRHMATTDYSQALELAEPPYPTEVEPLIRLADYQRLQAECEKLKEQLDAMAEYKVAAHQLIGIPASAGISEPIEGFAKRPQDIMPAVRDMALRIELLEHQAAERERLLAESRANDQQAMRYLNQVREIVGGYDFPDMVRRCEKLRKDAGRYRWLRDGASMLTDLNPWEDVGFVGAVCVCTEYGIQTALTDEDLDAAIDAAMEGDKP